MIRLTLVLWLAVGTAWAVNPDERLADPALEARARAISKELRCVVCQNQTIDDSDAGIARDMRVLVRDRLKAGDTDEAVRAFLVDRYGEYVLMRPRVDWHTSLLWGAPALFFLIGAILLLRHRRVASTAKLSDVEEQRLARLID